MLVLGFPTMIGILAVEQLNERSIAGIRISGRDLTSSESQQCLFLETGGHTGCSNARKWRERLSH